MPAMSPSRASGTRGFTLIEVLVAMALLVAVAVGLLDLLLRASLLSRSDRQQTIALALALERLDQLRSLSWGLGASEAPAPVADLVTDLSGPSFSGAGPGLSEAPGDTLTSIVPGWVDYADEGGGWVGQGGRPPVGTTFVRRWNVSRVPGLSGALLLRVRVSAQSAMSPVDVWLYTIKAQTTE
jgi:prepilin-type N-terminal cleavage/methylation domain-containing protein